MEKYQTKIEIIEAGKYELGMEDAFEMYIRSNDSYELIPSEQAYENGNLRKGVSPIVFVDGYSIPVTANHYIAIDIKGRKFTIKEKEFLEKYELLGCKGN